MSRARKRSILFALAALGLIAFAIWIRYASRIDFFRDAGWTYLRSAIYIFLFSAWGVSLSVRIVQTHTRRYLLSISALMVLWLLLRSIKYAAPLETVCRYLWYGYYLPLLFIPMFSLLVALSLGRSEDCRLPRWTRALYVAASILFLLVLTNDAHQWIFTFPNGVMSDKEHGYAPGYYVVVGWEVLCAASAMILVLVKCRLPHSRVYLSLPLIPFALSLAYTYAYVAEIHWVWLLAGDMTVALCLMFAGILESCIQCGLIQSNLEYDELFEATNLPVQITDQSLRTQHISAAMPEPLPQNELQRMTSDTVQLDGETLLKRYSLRRGYVFWKEDISELNQLQTELELTRDELRDTGDVLTAENVQRARLLKLTEENRLYDMMETQTSGQIAMLRERLAELKNTEDPDRARRLLGQIIIIGTYVKRRSNLIFVGMQRGSISMQELRLCLNESVENLNLYGVDCKALVKGDGQLSFEQAAKAYDLFETVVEATLDSLHSLLISIESGEPMEVNLCISAAEPLCNLPEQIPGLQWEQDEDGLQYITRKLKKTESR